MGQACFPPLVDSRPDADLCGAAPRSANSAVGLIATADPSGRRAAPGRPIPRIRQRRLERRPGTGRSTSMVWTSRIEKRLRTISVLRRRSA